MGYDFFRRDNLREPRSFAENAYFRITTSAYVLVYETMSALGILDPFVDAPDPQDASEEARAVRSPYPEAVPAFKFGSNDAWIVTPDECTIVATALERVVGDTKAHLQPSPDEQMGLNLLERFARFNRTAAAHGGYVVQ